MTSAIEKAKEVLSARIDQPNEPTDWFEMTQERINQFAEATLDHQWIHVDTERAAREMPGGKTIDFAVDGFRKHSLLNGLDDIGLTLRQSDEIDHFEAARPAWLPSA